MFPELPGTHLLAQIVAVQHSLFKMSSRVSGCEDQDRLSGLKLSGRDFIYRAETNGHSTAYHFISARRSVRNILLTAVLSQDKDRERESCASYKLSHIGPENRAQYDPCVFFVESCALFYK